MLGDGKLRSAGGDVEVGGLEISCSCFMAGTLLVNFTLYVIRALIVVVDISRTFPLYVSPHGAWVVDCLLLVINRSLS